MSPPIGEAYVLHPSVAARWWFRFPTCNDAAERCWRALIDGESFAVVAEDIAIQVVAQIEHLIREDLRLHVPSEQIGVYRTPIAATFRRMADAQPVRMEPNRPQDQWLAWGFASRYHLRFPDAWLVWLSVKLELPLLVADATLRQQLKDVEDDRSDFRGTLLASCEEQ